MNKYIKLKLIFNITFFTLLMIAVSISVYFIKKNIESHAIDNSVIQAKNMTNQLLITRAYMSTVAPKAKLLDPTLDDFALAPAFVGSHISDMMYKQYDFYIKQTSLKYRNIKNTPDEFEKNILQKYENKTIAGEYWETSQMDSKAVVRFSKPIYIKNSCLSCHGKPYIDVKKEMYDKLISKYGDRSFNYKEGDLRGIISVAIPIDSVFAQADYIYKNIALLIALFFIIILLYILMEKKYIFTPQVDEINKKEIYEETVIESNNNAIIAINSSGEITTYNSKAQEIFGWTKKEMIGTKNLLKIIPDKYKETHKKALNKFLSSGKSSGVMGGSIELEGIRKNGETFPMAISIGARYQKNNTIVVANISDISKEKDQELLLIQQSKMASMGEMMGNIAHQWRQPLSAITSTASAAQVEIELGLLSEKEINKSYEDIKKSAVFLSETIENFRHFFKEDTSSEKFNIIDVLTQIEYMIKDSYKNNSINITNDYSKQNIICSGVKNQFAQVIMNILNNAKDILIELNPDEKQVNIF